MLHAGEQLRKLSVVKAELSIKPDDTVLDVGSGTGLSFLLGCNIIGIEPSLEMREKSKGRITALQGTAESLPFPDKSFEKVISMTAVHNFNDIGKAVSEMRRVARETIVISVLKKSWKSGLADREISRQLEVRKIIDDHLDRIYFCSPGD